MADEIKFRPKAKPVDTVAANTNFRRFAAPVAPVKPLAPIEPAKPRAPERSNVDQLVAALANLNPKITGLLGQVAEDANKQDALDAEMRAMSDNLTSWGEAVAKDPSLADRSPVYRQVYEARTARTRVQKRAGELLGEYYTSDIASSEDPGAINKWLSDRMKDLYEGAGSPAEKAALIEEMQSVSKQFISGHRERSRGNLVEKNKASISASYQTTFDNYAARGPAAPYQTDDPVSLKALQDSGDQFARVKAAFLNGVAGGESSGKYNIRYDGGSGSFFELNAPHPKVMVPTRDGKKSSAAGRYQFTWSTWQEVWGADTDVPMTPENQDKAALMLAEREFSARTGGANLWETLDKEGLSPRVQATLAGRWEAFTGNRGRHLATFNNSLQRYGQTPQGPGAQNGHIPEMVEDIQKLELEAKKQGQSPADINKLSLEAITNAAIKHGDESLLSVALQPRPDGTPGAGMTVEGRQAIDKARVEIRKLEQQKQDHAWNVEKRQLTVRKREITQVGMQFLLNQIKEGKPLKFDTAAIERANKEHPELAQELMTAQKNLDDWNKSEDAALIAYLQTHIYSGRGTPDDVFKAIVNGVVKAPGTINNLYEQASRNVNKAFLNHPEIKIITENIERLVGQPQVPGLPKYPEKLAFAMMSFSDSLRDYQDKNPKATPAEIKDFANDQFKKIISSYRPDINQDLQTPENQDKARAADEQRKREAEGWVEPRAEIDWRNKPLFPNRKAIEDLETRRKGGDHVNNNLTSWAVRLKLSPQEYAEFVVIQKRLSESRPKQK